MTPKHLKKPRSNAQIEAATVFGVDVCVNAGAGSGKTSVLVDRFVHAVTKLGDTPDRILAVTFTERAANEMKERLVAEFLRLGRDDDRRALETAYIGTIHAFCARLLRENPIEAGIDPFFKVLSDGESDLLMAKVMDGVFEAQTDRPEWLEILSERGEDTLRKALLDLHAHYRALAEDESLLKIRLGPERKKAEVKLAAGLQKIAEEINRTPRNATETALLTAARSVTAAFSHELDWNTFFQVHDAMGAVKKMGRFQDNIEVLREDLGSWESAALQQLFAPQKAEFLRVFRAFSDAYEKEKRARALFDFDDLPLLAWKLLSGDTPEKKAVRERYRAHFRHLFVDEFQDTSPLQARLIDLLRSKGNLFIVGDRRQSIYAFRHAEPALFAHYEAVAGKKITLSENYRSRPEVLDFTNGFFSKEVFHDSDLQPLVPGKDFQLSASGVVATVTAVYGEDEDAKNLEEARTAEAEKIAACIWRLVQSGVRVENGGKEGRPICWGDIAILLRATTQASVYERALSRAGIPFYSVRSKGFFERPEVKDLICFLDLLDHPDDDVSLAAVLRSPLGRVSDDGLFWLARAAKKEDAAQPLSRVLEAPMAVPGLSEEDGRNVKAFRVFAEKIRASKNSVAVSWIIEEAARWSGYELQTIAGAGGLQRVANVRKLAELARSLEEKMPVDTSEFVRYVRSLAERDLTESEARIEAESTEAVLVSSIHAAKGLEFPCVFVANLGGKPNSKGPALIRASKERGLGWSAPNVKAKQKAFSDRSFLHSQLISQKTQDTEEGRLLYVAVTRAKERLFLCGSVKNREADPAEEATWMPSVLRFLGVTAEAPAKPVSMTSANAAVQQHIPDASAMLKRLWLPSKPYDLAADLTVTDVLQASQELGPEALAEEPQEPEPEDADRTPRNEYGTLFHAVIERLARERPAKVPPELLNGYTRTLSVPEKEEMARNVTEFWRGEWGSAVRHARRVYPELPFIYKTKQGMLKGQIDLLFQDARGDWVVLDYKTNRTDAASVSALAGSYAFQIGLYALVFSKLTGDLPSKGILYFTALPRAVEFLYDATALGAVEEKLELYFGKACGMAN